MVFAGLIILGLIAASGLGIEFLPDVRVPRLVVTAAYPGLPGAEVRVLLSIPLEDSLASLKGVRRVGSVSRDGMSTITLEYQWGTDMQMAGVEARERIDAVYPSLPSQAGRPMVFPIDPAEDAILLVGVFAKNGDLSLARRLAEREIRTRLQQVSGVGSIALVGGTREEVKVLVDQDRAAARGATLADVADALAGWNVDLPAGSITEGPAQLLVRTEGSVRDLPSLGNLLAAGTSGKAFAVHEVARIERGIRQRSSLFQVDAREGVGLSVRRRPGTSPVALSRGVREEIGRLARAYQRDLELLVVRDTSRFISRSLRDLAFSALAGAAIAFLVVLVFVRDLPTSLILISSVPVSIAISLAFLRVAGRSLNVMSIGGLSMGIGMMMDNSVVILENLQRRLGPGPREALTAEAVARAADEMSGSNTGSTVTSIVVFLPVIFLPGVIGALFTDLALSVIFSQVISLAVSVTLIPVLFLLMAGRRTPAARVSPGVTARVEELFRRSLRALLRRPLILVGVLAATTAVGIACLRGLAFEFLPAVDTGEVSVTVRLPAASAISAAAAAGEALAGRLSSITGVDMVHARAGGESDDAAYLADPLDSADILHVTASLSGGRRRTARAIAEEIRSALASAGETLTVELPRNIAAPLLGLSGSRTEVRVTGTDQQNARARALDVKRALEDGGAAAGVTLSPASEKPELRVVPDREAMARAGVDAAAVGWAARAGLDGVVPTRMSLDGRETDVRVQLATEGVPGSALVGRIRIRGPDGVFLLLSALARVTEARSPSALARADRRDVVTVQFIPEPSPRASARAAAGEALTSVLRAHPEAELLQTSALRESMSPLILALVLVVVLLYLVLGVQFESFVLPAYLLASLPLAFSGIFAGLALAGESLNADSILGIIVLFGIAVNNTIVLYETFARRVARSGPAAIPAAIYRGTAERVRPILMTMLTTVTALLPIAVDPTGSSTQSSMAAAIIGGLFVSTTLTLFAVPMIFLRHFRRHGHAG